MTATYNSNLASDLDKTRLFLGDTDTANAVFTDEEITASITLYTTPLNAAVWLAEAAAAKYSRMVSISIDGMTVDFGARSKSFHLMADRLRQLLANNQGGGINAPVLTGVSNSAMRDVAGNTDRPASAFSLGMHDDPPFSSNTFSSYDPVLGE